MKKIRIELIVLGENFRVKRVTNSTEWLPDQWLSKADVDKIVHRIGTEVLITKK
jgi:hypothetical protein